VGLDGSFVDHQPPRAGLIREAVGYEHKDFLLAVGELDRLGGGVRRVGEVVADDNGI
jgi:hypothetical protein